MPYSGKVLLFYEEGVLELLPLVAHFGLQPLITNICKDLADFSTSYLFHQEIFVASFLELCTSPLSPLKHGPWCCELTEQERMDRRASRRVGEQKKRKRLMLRQ